MIAGIPANAEVFGFNISVYNSFVVDVLSESNLLLYIRVVLQSESLS
jgi:hypothetical protein